MGDKTGIGWTDVTWNPLRGCTRVSPGCEHCYAETVAHRFSKRGQPYEGLITLSKKGTPRWNGKIRLVPERLSQPLRWTRPRMVFVNSMSDLFHEGVPFEYVAAVFGVMAAAPQHTFQVLTKRPGRARAFFDRLADAAPGAAPRHGVGDADVRAGYCARAAEVALLRDEPPRLRLRELVALRDAARWRRLPLTNVWLGVSVENQATADARIPELLGCPAAVRWVSYEPALGPVDFAEWIEPWTLCGSCGEMADGDHTLCPGCDRDDAITTWGAAQRDRWVTGERYADPAHPDLTSGPPLDWIVVGGESGPGARPFDLAWARSTIAQGRTAGVPVFVKQLGARPEWSFDVRRDPQPLPSVAVRETSLLRLRDSKGADPSEWPWDLRVQEWPRLGTKGGGE